MEKKYEIQTYALFICYTYISKVKNMQYIIFLHPKVPTIQYNYTTSTYIHVQSYAHAHPISKTLTCSQQAKQHTYPQDVK